MAPAAAPVDPARRRSAAFLSWPMSWGSYHTCRLSYLVHRGKIAVLASLRLSGTYVTRGRSS